MVLTGYRISRSGNKGQQRAAEYRVQRGYLSCLTLVWNRGALFQFYCTSGASRDKLYNYLSSDTYNH